MAIALTDGVALPKPAERHTKEQKGTEKNTEKATDICLFWRADRPNPTESDRIKPNQTESN